MNRNIKAWAEVSFITYNGRCISCTLLLFIYFYILSEFYTVLNFLPYKCIKVYNLGGP